MGVLESGREHSIVFLKDTGDMTTDKTGPPTIEELEAEGQAPWKTAGDAEPYVDEQVLFCHVKGFFETFVSFQDPRYYDVITAWTLHTWHIHRWRATGPLYLLGPVNSGKTTVLECLEELAYRGIRGGSMSNATMFRLSHAYTPTLLIDESQLYNREEWTETQAFLNERYRKGGRVWRMEGQGASMYPKFFNAYGATAFAGSSPPWEAMMSRSILLKMERGKPTEQTLTDLFFSEGARLRAWLKQYRTRLFKEPPRETELDHMLDAQMGGSQVLENIGVGLNPFPDPRPYLDTLHDYRVREIGWPLLALSPIDEPRENVLSYLQDLEKQHDADDEASYLADYVLALEQAVKDGGKVSAKEIRLQLATMWDMKTDSKDLPKTRSVMAALRTLGFHTTRVTGGLTGVLWDEKLMDRLRTRYTSSLSSLSSQHERKNASQSEDSEASDDNVRHGGIEGIEGIKPVPASPEPLSGQLELDTLTRELTNGQLSDLTQKILKCLRDEEGLPYLSGTVIAYRINTPMDKVRVVLTKLERDRAIFQAKKDAWSLVRQ